MSSTDPVLSMEDVTVQYDDQTAVEEALPNRVREWIGMENHPVRAVDDVSLDVEENEVVAVVGESGSGKTTLGKTAIGLQELTEGSVKYRGTDIWQAKRETRVDGVFFEDIRKKLQIIHQNPAASLNPYRTLMSILSDPLQRWYPELSKADRRKRILGLFEECGLTPPQSYEGRYPHELSGGEQQRVALVRALLAEPAVIFADEPTSALDPSLEIDIMDLMIKLQEEFDTSFLYVTHALENARYIAGSTDGKVAVMYMGEIVEFGPVQEVVDNPKHPYTQVLKWATLSRDPVKARRELDQEIPLRSLEAPERTNVPSGCRFHDRCPKARAVCVSASPDLGSEDSPDHRAACYREFPDHEYWDTEHLDEDGEIDVPT